MPWTDCGTPVAIDMLFGHVKLGTLPSTTVPYPVRMNRSTFGTTPSRTPRSKYAGSPPSMQITATGRDGQRYLTPLTSMPDRLMTPPRRSRRDRLHSWATIESRASRVHFIRLMAGLSPHLWREPPPPADLLHARHHGIVHGRRAPARHQPAGGDHPGPRA